MRQLRRMVQIVQETNVNTYCEIGMNGGHSIVAMLEANPQITAHAFDMMHWNYSKPIADLISLRFGSRFQLHRGNSHKTVPAISKDLGQSCDLIFIDGDHTPQGARIDMLNCRGIAAPGARVILDDIAIHSETRPGPVVALRQMEVAGLLQTIERYGTFPPGHRYNPCMRAPDTGRSARSVCVPWGFAVCAYVAAQLNNKNWTSLSIVQTARLTPELLLAGDHGHRIPGTIVQRL